MWVEVEDIQQMSASKPVVLIVEDEPDIAETYRLWLEDSYEVRTALDGEEGLSKLDAAVDVVLLDRMMPGLSGDALLERLRTEAFDCRVAMVTAVDPDFDILDLGFDAYLSKPVKNEELERTVEKLLERATYDSLRQRYYALVEKRATLESNKSRSELQSTEEFARLESRIEELRDQLSETLGEIDDDDEFVATLQQVGKRQ